jgi:hypothetical protein
VLTTRAAQPPLLRLGQETLDESRVLVREVARLRGAVRDVEGKLDAALGAAAEEGFVRGMDVRSIEDRPRCSPVCRLPRS